MHRPSDVLDPLLAAVLEGNVELVADLVAHYPADTDFSRRSQSFEPCGDIDAVAVNVALVEDHVAQIDADAEFDPLLHRHVGVALDHRPLHRYCAAYRVDDTREFDEQPVAGGLDNAASVLLDLGITQLAADRFQRGEGTLLVCAHQPRIPGDVGGQNRG